MLNLCIKNLHLDQTIAHMTDILSVPIGYLDPLEKPIEDVLTRVYLAGYEASVLYRTKREISKLRAMELKPELWMDKTCFAGIQKAVSGLDGSISGILTRRA
jgi:hypothetical protein